MIHVNGNSGLFFYYAYYIDWLNTGDKTKKEYSEVIDGDMLSAKELQLFIDKVDTYTVVKGYDNKQACIYLKSKEAWS